MHSFAIEGAIVRIVKQHDKINLGTLVESVLSHLEQRYKRTGIPSVMVERILEKIIKLGIVCAEPAELDKTKHNNVIKYCP